MGQNPILLGGVESSVSIFSPSTTQYHELGSKGELPDGRVFRYAKADGSGFSAGQLVKTAALTGANFDNTAGTVIAPIGSTTFTGTLGGACTENQFAGGYLWINDGTGEGHLYRVKSHPAGTTAVVFTLDDAIAVATAASSSTEYTLIANQYNGVGAQAAQASLAERHAGVAPATFAASTYGWIQTRGLCSVLASTTGPTVMQQLIAGAAGTCTVITAATEMWLGWCVIAEAGSGDQVLAYLTIE